MSKAYFISGIDTDAGKSICTGFLARQYMEQGLRVITQKFVQTGCGEYSEDIDTHRRIMDIPLQPRDLDHTTAPVIFSYPCSPHLAAAIDHRTLPLRLIDEATKTLLGEYDVVLIEGAGGLMVPLSEQYLTIDYVASRRLPLMLVVHGGLGSINHILLSLEAVKARGIELSHVLYNHYFDTDQVIAAETLAYVQRHLTRFFPSTELVEVPKLNL